MTRPLLLALLLAATLSGAADEHLLSQLPWRIHATNKADWSPSFAAANAIDGEPETYWYQNGLETYDLVIDLGRIEEIKGFRVSCSPQRAGDRIRAYELAVSDDPGNWPQAATAGTFTGDELVQEVTFPPRRGRFVRLRAKVDDPKQRVCVAELGLLGTGAPPATPSPDERFARRDEPGEIAVLGRDFLGMLLLDRLELHANGLRGRPEYLEVVRLYEIGQYNAALRAFRDYYLGKLRNPQAFGLTSADVDPYSSGISGLGRWAGPQLDLRSKPADIQATADKLMHGIMTIGGQDIAIGEPGQVNWDLAPPPKDDDDEPTPYRQLHGATGFNILVQAWQQTGNTKYLDRWFAYLDDWALNSDYLGSIHPCMVPSGDKGYDTVGLLRLLALIARAPGGNDLVPPATLARVLDKHIRIGPMPGIAYLRSNCHNWTPGMGLLLRSLMLDEFRVAEDWFREARRRNIEDNAVTQNLRDGTENQQCPWYNDNFLQLHEGLRLLEARVNVPLWNERLWLRDIRHDTQWRERLNEHLLARVNYYILNRTPQNQWPIPWRGGDRRGATGIPPENHYGNLQSMAPKAYADGENWKIVQAITNPEAGVRPSLTGNWFPYAGYNLVWDGWERDSGHGALFCSPHPGAYGGYRSRSNNNTFGLNAFGQDLLIDDTVGHYMYPSSPIKVDGLNQFFHAGVYKVGPPSNHKVFLVRAWTEPAPWRWHASDRFNLMEGIYAGPYGELEDRGLEANNYGPQESLSGTLRPDQTLQGITHQRLVQYVRAAGVWIVTDHLRAADNQPHDYEQVWYLPLKPSSFPAFEEADITVDAAARRIVTASTAEDQANLSLFQFTEEDLGYATEIVPNDPKNRYMVYGRKEIHVAWRARRPSQVITLAVPRTPGVVDSARDLRELTPSPGIRGFAATMPDGRRIEYLAAADKEGILQLGPVEARAESLLLIRHGDTVTGMVLGCAQMRAGGNLLEIPAPDFEFRLDEKSWLFGSRYSLLATPIFRPISPVVIGPDRDVFTDSVDVTMTSRTPGVEIRYTLDGSEPTPQSTLYDGPVELTHSAVIKARAYRPGVTANPVVLSGTLATAVSRATLTRTIPQPGVAVDATEPGLNCRYYEGPWQQLWMFLDELKPLSQAVVSEVFDLSPLPADNPPVGEAPTPRQRSYALEYSGYLDIPEDGVYTIHAPEEYVYPDIDAGYELRVYLGERRIPYGGRTEVCGLTEWYPATALHAFGNWSIALKQGLHPFRVVWVDYRTTAARDLNKSGINDYIWRGVTPNLQISGPRMRLQPIPEAWLKH